MDNTPPNLTQADYTLSEEVWIIAIEVVGRVRVVNFDERGLCYKVTYWWEGKREDAWLFSDEICRLEKKNGA